MNMDNLHHLNTLAHSVFECTYHIVFSTKYRKEILFGEVYDFIQQQTHVLCNQKDGIKVVELKIETDHIHLVLEIPPKYSVSSIIGYLKGRLSSVVLKRFESLRTIYWKGHLWSRGYCVKSIGLNKNLVRRYIRNH